MSLVRSFASLILLVAAACSIAQQNLPNEVPVINSTTADTLVVRRGGSIALEVRASDGDDDPLFYYWNDFGAGTFTDSTGASTSWIAPLRISPPNESFVLVVQVLDRDCTVVPDPTDRTLCNESAQRTTETVVVKVVQNPPVLIAATPDTTVSFHVPYVELSARAKDSENDPLEFKWTQSVGEPTIIQQDPPTPGFSAMRFVPTVPGDYAFAVEISDGSDTLTSEIAVNVFLAKEPPGVSDPTVALSNTLPDGRDHRFLMDVYEYPNEKGTLPQMSDWFEATTLCSKRGKRLCRVTEWRSACSWGLTNDQRPFSSNDNPENTNLPSAFGLRFCNVAGSSFATSASANGETGTAPSGSFPNCSSNGIYDLTGNVPEWLDIGLDETRRGTAHLSNATSNAIDCVTFDYHYPPLPEDLDPTDADAVRALDWVEYGDYFDHLRGFRCCRDL